MLRAVAQVVEAVVDGVAYAVGGYITAAYWFTSSTSFANPAVTVSRMFSDTFAGIAPSSAPMFVVMQLLGAALAYGVIRGLFPSPILESAPCCVPRRWRFRYPTV